MKSPVYPDRDCPWWGPLLGAIAALIPIGIAGAIHGICLGVRYLSVTVTIDFKNPTVIWALVGIGSLPALWAYVVAASYAFGWAEGQGADGWDDPIAFTAGLLWPVVLSAMTAYYTVYHTGRLLILPVRGLAARAYAMGKRKV